MWSNIPDVSMPAAWCHLDANSRRSPNLYKNLETFEPKPAAVLYRATPLVLPLIGTIIQELVYKITVC